MLRCKDEMQCDAGRDVGSQPSVVDVYLDDEAGSLK